MADNLEGVIYDENPSSGRFFITNANTTAKAILSDLKKSIENGSQSAQFITDLLLDSFMTKSDNSEFSEMVIIGDNDFSEAIPGITLTEDQVDGIINEISEVVASGPSGLPVNEVLALDKDSLIFDLNGLLVINSGYSNRHSWEYTSDVLKKKVYITLIGESTMYTAFVMMNNEFIPLCCITTE